MLPEPEIIVSRKSESAIRSKIVINFYIVIRFGECGYLVLTIDDSFGTRFFHYGFSFNSNSVVSVSYLVYVCYGP